MKRITEREQYIRKIRMRKVFVAIVGGAITLFAVCEILKATKK